ncbi:hypothetical protein [Natrinema altunense]|uniref:Uncharacterized protein n=1 Tax=Natrinema altunense TaxID=222984 RepID=A0A482XWJ8_9EURY|nr:hypothetical protein [Natrinema altunense]RZH66333.1 hypothetical protein ELS17_16760 [Natrinema altunense]
MASSIVTTTTVRRAEVALAVLVLGSGIVILAFGGAPSVLSRSETIRDALIWSLFFLVPLALAGTTLLAVVADTIGIGSVVAGAVAVITLGTVLLAVYTLLAPSEGGVYFGHFFSYGAALALSVVVLVRPIIDRLSAGVWLRPGLIDFS